MRGLALIAMLLCAGCAGDTTGTVSGQVTFNGQPLEKGLISFSTQDGQGGTGGSEVLQGRYRVAELRPGKYFVHIAGQSTSPIITPGSPEAERKLSQQEINAMMDPLPAGANGNDQTIEVQAGEQTHDFRLEES